MKEYLTGISLCAALLLAGGCSNENDMTNSNGNPVPLTVRATAGSFEEVPETGKSDAPATRTPTEDGNTTTFATGDAIGIFAIKDGAIVDGISNSKLTYSEGADSARRQLEPGRGHCALLVRRSELRGLLPLHRRNHNKRHQDHGRNHRLSGRERKTATSR